MTALAVIRERFIISLQFLGTKQTGSLAALQAGAAAREPSTRDAWPAFQLPSYPPIARDDPLVPRGAHRTGVSGVFPRKLGQERGSHSSVPSVCVAEFHRCISFLTAGERSIHSDQNREHQQCWQGRPLK